MKIRSKWPGCFSFFAPRDNGVIEVDAELAPNRRFLLVKMDITYRLRDGDFEIVSASEQEREEMQRRGFKSKEVKK